MKSPDPSLGRAWRASLTAALAAGMFVFLAPAAAWAGGGGQNLFVLVNPNDENALRVANAYQALRAIPDSHIFFYDPPNVSGHDRILLSETQFDDFLLQVDQAITARGLASQIDYIGMLGVPFRFSVENTSSSLSKNQSMAHGMMQLTQYRAGTEPIALAFHETALYEGTTHTAPTGQLTYVAGANAAIHHSDIHVVGAANFQYYMAGTSGVTWQWGMTADQVIANLERSVLSDGTRPAGTIYFEENDNVRSNTREFQWPAVQAELTARGLPWIEERNVSGATPLNRSDVRGAVVGSASPRLPNGSIYLPGSWADSLTSTAGNFQNANQVKAIEFLQAGAGGTSGTVVEPFAISDRFPDAAIFLFIEDGSTLGEAYYKAMREPTVIHFMGDLLAQPYADVPSVAITAGPAEGQTVSGAIAVDVSGSLSAPVIATAVSRMELYVDGLLDQTIAGASATFNIDTTTLDDGEHEFRFVGVNDAQAESEGYLLRHLNVDNHGRSVSIPAGDVVAGASDVVAVAVQAVAGDGSVSSVELRHLGRVLGSVASASGNINVNAATLAFGGNAVVPVAIFTDGQEVAGPTITFTRNPLIHPGAAVTPLASRTPGIRAEYFLGKGGASVAASDYSGVADVVKTFDRALLGSPVASGLKNTNGQTRGITVRDHPAAIPVDDLAFRIEGRFEIPAGEAGEYGFMLYKCNDSARLSIDGVDVMSYDNNSSGASNNVNAQGMITLGEGEHTLEYLAANRITSTTSGNKDFFDVSLWMRGPDGITKLIDDAILYVLAGVDPISPPDLMDASDTGSSNSDDITMDNTPSFTGIAPAGSTVFLTAGPILGGATQVGSAVAGVDGVWEITASPLLDGVHLVKATDGGATVSGGILVTIDTVCATPSGLDLIGTSDRGVSNTDDLTNDTTPTIAAMADDGDAVDLASDIDGAIGSGTGPDVSITASVLAEGTHQITATASDLAGNASAVSVPLFIEIDTTPPAAPADMALLPASDSGISNTDKITNVVTPTFTGTTDADAIVTLADFAAGGAIGSGAGPNVSITTIALADGPHSVFVSAADPAGNTSFVPFLSITIDTVSPEVSIEQAAGQPDPASGLTIGFEAVFNEAVSGFESGDVVVGGTAASGAGASVGGADPGTTYAVAVTGMNYDGTISASILAAAATDVAGNPNAASTSVDNLVQWSVPVPDWPMSLVHREASDGTVSLKWSTDIGVMYKVQYSDDLDAWSDVLPPIPGTVATEEFVDDGPPKTVSHPSTVPRRYYRVMRLP